MPFVELIVAVCLTADPDVCSERRFQFFEGGSLFTCMVRAQPFLAEWSTQNREYTVKTWTCGYPGERDRKA